MSDTEVGLPFFMTVIEKAVKYGDSWAEAKQISWRLEELKKSVLAEIMNRLGDEAAKRSEKITEAKLERMAMASKEYIDHVTAMTQARSEEIKMHVRYTACLNSFEARRSVASLEKKKIALL